MDLSAVPVQTLAKVAARAHTLDVSNTSLSPTQANAIFTALVNNCDAKEIDFCDNSLSLVPHENIAMVVAKTRTVLLANTSISSPQAVAIITAVSTSEPCNLHTLDLSNNQLAAVEPVVLAEAIMKLESITLYDTSLTLAQVSALQHY